LSLDTHFEFSPAISTSPASDPARYRFDPAGSSCALFELESLNALENIDAVLAESLREEPLEESFWEQCAIPSPWNIYWTEAAAY